LSSSSINDPQHWRARAKQARILAEQINDQMSREMMLGIADDYEHLAERAEERAKKPPAKNSK
jgi:hypothetical protein